MFTEISARFQRNCFGFASVFECNGWDMDHLKDIGEDALISRLVGKLAQGQDVVVGPGDDCAVIDVGDETRYLLLKTDCLVEHVHYLPETAAGQVGWKAIARVISDFAAMGGRPAQLLVTLVMPGSRKVSDVELLYEGMQRCAAQFGSVISGGETSSVPEDSSAVISISGTGWVKKTNLVTRSNGKAGDVILVTGLLGGSIKGKHLTFVPRVNEAAWLTENFEIHAMMDLSDGLGKDLPRLAKLSGCGYQIHESRIPCNEGVNVTGAISDGEDYELLVIVSPRDVGEILQQWNNAFPDLPLTAVGELTANNKPQPFEQQGWEHFTS